MKVSTSPPRILVFYSDTFQLPLPDGHRFPAKKYRLVRERLQAGTFRDQLKFCLPRAATDEELLLVHTSDYLNKLKSGTLSQTEQRRIGFPCSPSMVERSRRSTGATIGAARAAIDGGTGVHLAGGTHHAFPERGQGFCVFNNPCGNDRHFAPRSASRLTKWSSRMSYSNSFSTAVICKHFSVVVYGNANGCWHHAHGVRRVFRFSPFAAPRLGGRRRLRLGRPDCTRHALHCAGGSVCVDAPPRQLVQLQ